MVSATDDGPDTIPDQSKTCRDCMNLRIMESLPSHIAILDENGVILETNEAWKRFANNGSMPCAFTGIGDNYMNVCRLDPNDINDKSLAIAQGIQDVLCRKTDQFRLEYEFQTPQGAQWYYIRVVRLAGPGPVRLIVSHEDITDLKTIEHALKQKEKELHARTVALEEKNIALKVLLEHRENDRSDLDQRVLANVKTQLLPYVEKLKQTPLKQTEKRLVEIIDKHLHEIISPMMKTLSNLNIVLTPQEIQVASLVKDGKSSQEIADILYLSEATVHFHRKNIRNKLKIQNTRTNLRTHLMTLT